MGTVRPLRPTQKPSTVTPSWDGPVLDPSRYVGTVIDGNTAPLSHRSRREKLRDGTRRLEMRLYLDFRIEMGFFENPEACDSFNRWVRLHGTATPLVVTYACPWFRTPDSDVPLPPLRSSVLWTLLAILAPPQRGQVLAGMKGWARLFVGKRLLLKVKTVTTNSSHHERPEPAHYTWVEAILREMPIPRARALPPDNERGSTSQPSVTTTPLGGEA